ncbi:phosphorylase [Oscillatoria sp. CS-180]|uniref:ATP adenylyltransferase family protein n=1 Tax=Oscillatoria sp. CS-180 TaxID=3021720 RepID=UPI00232F6640|nr:phosphorylase [Oscillatoria sp. CS-180]MDB9526026.1 phosphorylase [Oscillatoria sp. CS-180]
MATSSPASDSLWQLVLQTTQQALESGALEPISTHNCELTENFLIFLVRIVDSIARKEKAKQAQEPKSSSKPFNPFLPYDPNLFVADLSASHVCLLNKFNVVDHHLLMVTREYVSQQAWLTGEDFEALAYCLTEIEGLGFYNGGTDAGASQHHKHLQLVPFSTNSQTLPIATAIEQHHDTVKATNTLPVLPFWHSVRLLSVPWHPDNLSTIAASLLETYRQIMADLTIDLEAAQPDAPYNLLVTREWMMGVRRSRASYEGIGVNSLGYGGWLLVKDEDDLRRLQQIGPMMLLQEVGQSAPTMPFKENAKAN